MPQSIEATTQSIEQIKESLPMPYRCRQRIALVGKHALLQCKGRFRAAEDHEQKVRLRTLNSLMPELADIQARCALQGSGGQEKLVARCRALAVGKRLLLLDEPVEGVAPASSMRLADVIHQLKGSKLAVLISRSEVNHSGNRFVIERGANSVVNAKKAA